MAAAALTVSAGAAASFAVTAASASPGGSFSAEICKLVPSSALAAADINTSCIPLKARSALTFGAHWGAAGSAHWLSVFIVKEPAMLIDMLRARVLSHGAPVKVGTIGSVYTDTYNGDRKQGDVLFLAGRYLGHVALNDDDPSASEAAIAAALVPIARAVAVKLK